MSRLVFLVGLLAACGGGANPSWRASNPEVAASVSGFAPRDFAPAGSPVLHYNAGPIEPGPASPIGDAILDVFRQAARDNKWPMPVADERLFAAAQDVAGLLDAGEVPPYAIVEFSLSHHGIVEPSPEMLIVQGDERAPESLAQAIAGKVPATLGSPGGARVGVGVRSFGGGAVQAVVFVLASGLDTDPILRQVSRGGTIAVSGKLRPPYTDPTVYVTGSDGKVTQVKPASGAGAGFRAEVKCDVDGRRQVEVIGRGAQGVTVLANFPVYCGIAPPRTFALAPERDDLWSGARDAEQLVFKYMNEDRAVAGLPALIWDEKAAGIARSHSQDMHAGGWVAHVSPTTGSAADRARAGGLTTPLVLENVARAYSPSEAHGGFMNSPGHRANVLHAEATHVGLGVVVGREVSGRRELYVTQLFFMVPRKVPPAELRQRGVAAIAGARQARGVGALHADPELDRIAQAYAGGMAKGGDQGKLGRVADAGLDQLATRYRSVVTVVMIVGTPEQLTEDELLDPTAERLGLGLAQGPHPQLGSDAIFVVVLLGRPR